MKVIEGKFRVLSEDSVPVRKRRRLPRAIRYMNSHPILWIWAALITVVGLTEGLW